MVLEGKVKISEVSFVRKFDKNSLFCHFFILQTHFILCIVRVSNCTYKCKIKTLKNIYKKRKEFKKENGKVVNRKLGKVENLENLGKIIPSFLIPSFQFYPTAKSKTRIQKAQKKNSSFLRFLTFPSFRPGLSEAIFQSLFLL